MAVGTKRPRRGSLSERLLTHEGLVRLRGWARDGLTYDQIAANCGVDSRTLYEAAARHPEIKDALAQSRELADREVENALFRRAVGYKYTETKHIVRDTLTNPGEEHHETEKEMPPDTAAIIFYLKNRCSDRWNDRQDVSLSGQVGLVQIIDDVPRAAPPE